MKSLEEEIKGLVQEDRMTEESQCWVDPITGEVIDPNDIDSLLEAHERYQEVMRSLRAWNQRVRQQCLALTSDGEDSMSGPTTRRLRGSAYEGVLTLPPITFEQRALKELWNSKPELASEYLRIQSLSVKMREYKKLLNTTGDEELESFKAILKRADLGRVGTPTLQVKPIEKKEATGE